MGIGSMEPAHAQEIAGDPTTSLSMTVLEANDPIIHQLSQLDAVKTANSSIGIPDWTSVSKIQRGVSSDAVYVIIYQPHTSKEVVKATFLCVGSNKAIVAQLLHTNEQANEQTMQFAWLTPEMHYLGTTITNKDGKVEASTENPYQLGVAGTAIPYFSFSCFITCLTNAHVPGWCLAICDVCSFVIPVCLPCAGCAAGSYFYCVATC